MKRRLHIPLTIVLATALMAGCSSSSDDDDDTGTDTGQTDSGDTDSGDDGSDGGDTDTGGDGGDTGNDDGGSTDGGSTGGLSGDVTVWGTVSVDQNDDFSAETVELSAGFFQISGTQLPPAATLLEFAIPSEDTCEVSRGDTDDFDIPDFEELDFTTVDAGDVITFTSPAGTYAELSQTTAFGFTFYEDSVEDRAGPAPSGLVVDIPGGTFPAFSNAAIPDVDALVVTSPASSDTFGTMTMTPSTVFTWEAGSNPDARIAIDSFSFDFTSGDTISLTCTVMDDGSFTLPANIQAELGSDFEESVDVERIALSFQQQGSAVLILTNQY